MLYTLYTFLSFHNNAFCLQVFCNVIRTFSWVTLLVKWSLNLMCQTLLPNKSKTKHEVWPLCVWTRVQAVGDAFLLNLSGYLQTDHIFSWTNYFSAATFNALYDRRFSLLWTNLPRSHCIPILMTYQQNRQRLGLSSLLKVLILLKILVRYQYTWIVKETWIPKTVINRQNDTCMQHFSNIWKFHLASYKTFKIALVRSIFSYQKYPLCKLQNHQNGRCVNELPDIRKIHLEC